MILSDRDILDAIEAGDISIDPFDEARLQPASYDLHLDRFFKVYDRVSSTVIDPRKPIDNLMEDVEIEEDDVFVLHPGGFALGLIAETTGVSDEYVGRLEGKSSIGRLGLIIHTTAGFLDPGNCLQLTLELHNTAELPIILCPGMPIGQIAFERLSSAAKNPYGAKGLGSKYSGDTRPVASQMHKNFNPETGEWR